MKWIIDKKSWGTSCRVSSFKTNSCLEFDARSIQRGPYISKFDEIRTKLRAKSFTILRFLQFWDMKGANIRCLRSLYVLEMPKPTHPHTHPPTHPPTHTNPHTHIFLREANPIKLMRPLNEQAPTQNIKLSRNLILEGLFYANLPKSKNLFMPPWGPTGTLVLTITLYT